MSIRPPFRADQVGSLLRSAPLKAARDKKAKGEISAAELTAIEDEEIRKLIAKQEAVGLEGITDGEYRRSWWHYDFLWNLDGVERIAVDQGIQFAGVQTKAEAPHVMKKIGFSGHP
ncbi:MAG: 5-methyltetrahydropteroyltriglutamate--homocysteine S-methyltransferase, partial [Hyphomicrobiales bacterium]|nr:5-methyltetrahydropteroyltriglutamate--homocysteine S-methyltransferase [Hyphomicrobiales bacterium]